jgi:hypothetical protein
LYVGGALTEGVQPAGILHVRPSQVHVVGLGVEGMSVSTSVLDESFEVCVSVEGVGKSVVGKGHACGTRESCGQKLSANVNGSNSIPYGSEVEASSE